MANPTASLSIKFSTALVDGDGNPIDGESYLSAEVNSDDNNGKTSFVFGDTAYYRVYKSDDIASLSVVVSDGSESGVSAGNLEELKEAVAFANSQTASVGKYLHQLLSAAQIGGLNLGSISKAGATSVQCSKASSGPLDPLVGVYQLTYNTRYDLRKLYNVAKPAGFGVDGFNSYPVVVYLIGVVA